MTDVDRQIERAADALERARSRTAAPAGRSRRKREAEVARRVGRIAVVDAAIVVGALVVSAFVPLGVGGAFLVMALLIAATLFLAMAPASRTVVAEQLAETPLRALPSQTEAWLESQRRALPAPAQTLVDSIGVRLDTLAPQLATLDEREPAAAEVRKLVGEQLPELVKGYTRVPEPLRRTERNGATPDQQLVDGLRLIDEEIAGMTAQLAQGDLDLLATRGRYLQIRYQGDDRV
ncbi:HAD family hydrolase [Sphingomonas baiyangensis]|uniref:5-bromo-4-chloroindolyl phosphate hydrolysis protein n=1 Tax=Sphingomonas baiyangensis TaxID=2572576 RepID=A0A4U1L2L2_9SPHN|nr:hypothetical protein [Sphingomonas baiyangensis]TKD50852.1 hypothetical protein FBR43_08795 [Sphingomonas baiyangensis]